MFEKVNPEHPDKVADRIAGAIVDLAYTREENPKVAVEVLIGHGYCYAIIESSIEFEFNDIQPIVTRLAKGNVLRMLSIPQDKHLADNQQNGIRCGDNGIFRGVPVTEEEKMLTATVERLYREYPTDGKYLISGNRLIACQSCAGDELWSRIKSAARQSVDVQANPLGTWTGGVDVDSGATNRKLGSDMGRAVTGGGLHGKDLSKADVSVNIMCHKLAQELDNEVTAFCAIGDEKVIFKIGKDGGKLVFPYDIIVRTAKEYIDTLGGFERFAEWGLIR